MVAANEKDIFPTLHSKETQRAITCSESTVETTPKQVWKMFKVNNKEHQNNVTMLSNCPTVHQTFLLDFFQEVMGCGWGGMKVVSNFGSISLFFHGNLYWLTFLDRQSLISFEKVGIYLVVDWEKCKIG